jgi:hypothetical protein
MLGFYVVNLSRNNGILLCIAISKKKKRKFMETKETKQKNKEKTHMHAFQPTRLVKNKHGAET